MIIKSYTKPKYSGYDVVYTDDFNTDCEDFQNKSYEYCLNFIRWNNGTNKSYFADYKGGGGTVSICDAEGNTVYSEDIKDKKDYRNNDYD